jgi:chromosome segregation ATPase
LKRQIRHLHRVEKENLHFWSDIALISQDKEALKQQVHTIDSQISDLGGKLEFSGSQSFENEITLHQENRKLRYSNEVQKVRICELEHWIDTPQESVSIHKTSCEYLRNESSKSIKLNEELRKQTQTLEETIERKTAENEDHQSQLSKKNLELTELKRKLMRRRNRVFQDQQLQNTTQIDDFVLPFEELNHKKV